MILQAFDGLRGELFLFIVVKFAYYLAYRPDVRERIGIFAYNRLEFAYLSGTYDAYKQLLVVMLEHSDGRRNRDAVSEFGYNLFVTTSNLSADLLESNILSHTIVVTNINTSDKNTGNRFSL